MDYVFFGFSALSCGIGLLLLFHLRQPGGTSFRVWQYVAAAAFALLYYLLGLSLLQPVEALYYLGNILPYILLFLLVVLSLLRKKASGKTT